MNESKTIPESETWQPWYRVDAGPDGLLIVGQDDESFGLDDEDGVEFLCHEMNRLWNADHNRAKATWHPTNETQRMRGRAVTHEEALKSAHRLIARAHNGPGEKSTMSIPVRATDDDIVLCDRLLEAESQLSALQERLRETEAELDETKRIALLDREALVAERVFRMQCLKEERDKSDRVILKVINERKAEKSRADAAEKALKSARNSI